MGTGGCGAHTGGEGEDVNKEEQVDASERVEESEQPAAAHEDIAAAPRTLTQFPKEMQVSPQSEHSQRIKSENKKMVQSLARITTRNPELPLPYKKTLGNSFLNQMRNRERIRTENSMIAFRIATAKTDLHLMIKQPPRGVVSHRKSNKQLPSLGSRAELEANRLKNTIITASSAALSTQ